MCGMTRIEDIDHAVYIGVDALGFIFYPKSARYVSIEKVKELLKNVPPFIEAVAVLVNAEPDYIERLLNELPINLLQFHGDESPEFCHQFHKPFIKAIHPQSESHIQKSIDDFSQAQALLLDTPAEHIRGGSGHTFDWRIIPKDMPKSYILAGGLNEFNVLDAINICNPYAVDVCSGIEALPGIKDHIKMSRFIKALWGR